MVPYKKLLDMWRNSQLKQTDKKKTKQKTDPEEGKLEKSQRNEVRSVIKLFLKLVLFNDKYVPCIA